MTKIKPKYGLNLTKPQQVIVEVVDNKAGNGAHVGNLEAANIKHSFNQGKSD